MLIGPPNTDNPKPQGRAIIIENLIAESILLFTISLSPAAYERIIDGTIAAANADAIAIGIVVSTLYCELYTPHNANLASSFKPNFNSIIFWKIGLSNKLLML